MERGSDKLHRDLARHLRDGLTPAEQHLWQYLRKRQLGGHRFRRQMPLGRYIADFVCIETRLVVELDGRHHSDPEQYGYDQVRDDWMQQQQFHVLRFRNHDALNHTQQVLDNILLALNQAKRHT